MKRLIIAPHADDETLGCGGTIAKHPDEFTVAVLSDKGDGRMDEHERARKALGYATTILAPFTTGTLTDQSRAVTTWLDALVREHRPDIMYLPTPDAHQDHSAAYESGIRAARLSYTGRAWHVPTVLLYSVPSYTTDLYTIPYPFTRYEALTEEHLEAKIAAIGEYRSQTLGDFDPAEMARGHARYVGARCGTLYAEHFAVVRDIRH